jgi:pyruvate dehydrogenase E2 component (dihydrolipoamide acetyltransferase)
MDFCGFHSTCEGLIMANPIVLPRLGNTVESCILVDWKIAVGDTVAEGDVIAEVETDKAIMEVESSAAGTVLALLFAEGDDVPVMAEIAMVGEAGEEFAIENDESKIVNGGGGVGEELSIVDDQLSMVDEGATDVEVLADSGDTEATGRPSPRARNLAARKGIDAAALAGSGPGGRIIERDVEAALAGRPKLSPVAEAKLAEGVYTVPAQGSGPSGRIMAKDLLTRDATTTEAGIAQAAPALAEAPPATRPAQPVETIPVKGIRKVIAQRMLESIQTTAQLTLNASADARALQALRARFKTSPEALGLQRVTINDLVLFATARALTEHPDLNALFLGDVVERHPAVHLGVAVDTPRGLMVPVVRNADSLGLKALADESKRLAEACLNNRITPDELTGGTFTVTNLGAFGVESFTPVLNLPQVAILGVGGIGLKPVEAKAEAEGVAFVPHIGLSLTINHQVVDGAPAARFLQTLSRNLANIDLLLAV